MKNEKKRRRIVTYGPPLNHIHMLVDTCRAEPEVVPQFRSPPPFIFALVRRREFFKMLLEFISAFPRAWFWWTSR